MTWTGSRRSTTATATRPATRCWPPYPPAGLGGPAERPRRTTGGDEFAVLITRYDRPDELDVVLDRILTTIREPTPTDDATCLNTASVGVALLDVDGSTADELETAADTAMYAANAQGGDRAEFFQPAMNAAAENRRRLRADLSEAIRTNAFQMYYQPIVHPDGTAWGAEALIRWDHNGQVIPAAQFIGFCEESGLIRALGPITLGLLNADLASLRQAGRTTLPVTVNLSVAQQDPGLTETLTHGSAPAGLSGLVIEVTESVFLPAHGGALKLRGITRRLGARIAVDDFGSGFSNLRLLRALSPDYIKLDKSFLSSEPTGLDLTHHRPRPSPDDALLTSAINMAHALGAQVIAEGVENEAQLKPATGLGADLIQGFDVALPMALPDLLIWLDSQQHHRASPEPADPARPTPSIPPATPGSPWAGPVPPRDSIERPGGCRIVVAPVPARFGGAGVVSLPGEREVGRFGAGGGDFQLLQ